MDLKNKGKTQHWYTFLLYLTSGLGPGWWRKTPPVKGFATFLGVLMISTILSSFIKRIFTFHILCIYCIQCCLYLFDMNSCLPLLRY